MVCCVITSQKNPVQFVVLNHTSIYMLELRIFGEINMGIYVVSKKSVAGSG